MSKERSLSEAEMKSKEDGVWSGERVMELDYKPSACT